MHKVQNTSTGCRSSLIIILIEYDFLLVSVAITIIDDWCCIPKTTVYVIM